MNRWHLTPEIHAEIVAHVAAGASHETAASCARIPPTTLAGWLRRGRAGEPGYEALALDVDQARAQIELRLVSYVRQSAENGQWQAAAWLLERVWPERYGKRAVEAAAASEGLRVVVRIAGDADGRDTVDADAPAE